MRPQEYIIILGTEEIVIRPSLRVACALDQRYGGFQPLVRAVLDGTVHVIADVMHEADINRTYTRPVMEAAIASNVRQLATIVPQILTFILSLCGIDEATTTSDSNSASDAKAPALEAFADHHSKLFRIAAGWLGWTPRDAWEATPNEILEAYRGRIELLQSIFGSGSTESEATNGFDASTLDTEGLQGLKGLGAV